MEKRMKKLFPTNSLISVIKVSDYAAALAWYGAWLGEPDEVPMEGMAEWRIADNTWLQLDASEGAAHPAAVVIGVNDVAACRAALLTAGIAAGDIVDWEVVLCCDLHDPDGNRISLAQVVG